jgi:hypothetical protein
MLLPLALGLSSVALADEDPETKRDVVVNKMDKDNNKRLDGKEMRTFKKTHPKMHESLMNFCDKAKDHPRKMGVALKKDASRKQKQCKKCHVARPYLVAWTAEGAPLADPNDCAGLDDPRHDNIGPHTHTYGGD